jgi:glycosyltransferase involved in cell wall biosynthesis
VSLVQPFVSDASHDAIVERDAAIAERDAEREVRRQIAMAEMDRAYRGVTVCITYHNEEPEILERAFWSAVAQTVKPIEILVIDDGSDTPPKGWDHLLTGPPVPSRVVSITNRGLPAARNVGLMLAKGGAFLPLDADDWLDPHYIEKTLPLLVDLGNDVVLTGLQEHGPTRNGTYMPGYDRPWHLVSLEQEIDMNRFYYCSLFRTQTLREVGGYNPLMAGPWNQGGGYEDHDLWIDLMARKAKFAAVEEVLFHYSTETTDSMVHRAARNRDALLAEMRRHHRLD